MGMCVLPALRKHGGNKNNRGVFMKIMIVTDLEGVAGVLDFEKFSYSPYANTQLKALKILGGIS